MELAITLNTMGWIATAPVDIELAIGPENLTDEIDTWLDVDGVDERYKAKCCAEYDGKGLIRETVAECANFGQSPQQYLGGKPKTAANQPWADRNFL